MEQDMTEWMTESEVDESEIREEYYMMGWDTQNG